MLCVTHFQHFDFVLIAGNKKFMAEAFFIFSSNRNIKAFSLTAEVIKFPLEQIIDSLQITSEEVVVNERRMHNKSA